MSDPDGGVAAVRAHYDAISPYYRRLWGEHIHHGYWEGDAAPPAVAQVRLVERLAARARVPRGGRVLDVGCGLGGSSRWLARNLGCSVLGVTLSPAQAEMATRQARAEGLDRLTEFRVMDANRLELAPEQFDAVWVVECSEHLDDKRRFIEACARVLRPGGVLAVCAWVAPDGGPPGEQAELLGEICRAMLCPALASRGDYAGWMRAAGFDPVEAEDVSERVRRTWDLCAAIARRWWVRLMLRLRGDAGARRFVASFPLMQRAFAEGAMGYGMLVGWKPA
jgi:tocopherol O-methyltransferase